jgi:histidinol-phosphate aminotransferase
MKKVDFTKLTKENILSLQAYEAKEIPCRVKLDANESPYSPVADKNIPLKKKIFSILNRYPDPEARELKKVVAGYFKINPDNILFGNGSDELIYYLIVTFGGPVLYPIPTFSMYGIISSALGEMNIAVPLNESFDIDTGKMLAAVREYNPKLVFLSSPNNPTGNCFSYDGIIKIIEASNGIVVVDEAYLPFSKRKSFIPLLKDYKNLAILRTFSKIGLAALRAGFLIGDRDLIKEVNKVRLPYNLNALSQIIASDVLKDKRVIQSNIKSIVSERKKLFRELSNINGVKPYESEANFILFRVDNADIVFSKLLKLGVLVRNMNGVIKDALRVTIGTPEENNSFIKALQKAIRRHQ